MGNCTTDQKGYTPWQAVGKPLTQSATFSYLSGKKKGKKKKGKKNSVTNVTGTAKNNLFDLNQWSDSNENRIK